MFVEHYAEGEPLPQEKPNLWIRLYYGALTISFTGSGFCYGMGMSYVGLREIDSATEWLLGADMLLAPALALSIIVVLYSVRHAKITIGPPF